MTTANRGDTVSLSFEDWLDQQQEREDVVGALALGIATYGTETLDLGKRNVRRAIRAAFDEYHETVEGDTEAPSATGARG